MTISDGGATTNGFTRISVDVGGQTVEGKATLVKDVLWVHFQGETFIFEDEQRTARGGGRRAKGAQAASDQVVAPMPGKIIKLFVKPGDAVSVGKVLVVMEAMKMEYALKSQADGVVQEISCAAGDQVALGQLLVRLAQAPTAVPSASEKING